MLEIIELLITIIPFIVGLIGISLIPSKDKIMDNRIKSYKAEKQIVVYMIGFFILILGTYYLIASLFGEGIEDLGLIYFFNGLFLGIIGIGIIGVTHRNFSILSEKGLALEERVEASEVAEIAEVAEIEPDVSEVVTSEQRSAPKQINDKELQKVECPKCGEIIKVKTLKRPVKISCPNCGIEGIIQ